MKKRLRVCLLSVLSVLLSVSVTQAQTHRSVVGTTEVKLMGSVVQFEPTMEGGSYASAAGEQVTVFKSMVAGNVASLSVEWLAVSTSAVFEVYAGAKAEGTPLFASSTAGGKTEWRYFQGDPGKDGGALTVRFDANGKKYSPTTDGRAGWKASARSVGPDAAAMADWRLDEKQPSAVTLRLENDSLFLSHLLVAGKKGELQRLAFVIGQDGVEAQSVKLAINGTTVDGTVSGRSVAFDLTPAQELKLGWNEISIVATFTDIPAGAEQLSLFPVAVRMDGQDQTARLFPSGVSYAVDRKTLPQIVLEKKLDEHDTRKIDWPYAFVPLLDDKGKYKTGNEELAVLLEPSDGKVVRIDFDEFELNGDAVMEIFYGADGSEPLAAFTKNDVGVSYPVIGRKDKGDGKLLVKFNPKRSNNSGWNSKIGWRARVQSVEAEPWRMESVTTSLWKEEKTLLLYPNEERVMYRVVLESAGAEGEKPLQKITFGGENLSSLAKMSVYSSIKLNYNGTVDESKSKKLADITDLSGGSAVLDLSGHPMVLSTKGAELAIVGVAAEPEKVASGAVRLFAESCTFAGSADAVSVEDKGKLMPKTWEARKAIYMKDGEATIDKPIEFYDDGGPNATPSKGFEGTLVLRPALTGARVAVEFKNFALVANTYTPENSDQMEVFSGSGADRQSLWKFDPAAGNGYPKGFTVVSESDDGSISVYFKSPRATVAGFTAEVRQIENKPVKVSKVTREVWNEYAGRRPLRAGLPGSLMLLNVQCEGTQPEAAVKAIKFHVEGVALQRAEVSRYDVSTSKVAEQLGMQSVDGQDVELMLDAPFPLKYGANLFAVEGTAVAKTNTDDRAIITDVRIVLNDGSEQAVTPAGTVTETVVKNEYELEHEDYAPRTLVVGAEWKVKQEGASYTWGSKGGALTLKPVDAEALVALELREKFDFSQASTKPSTRFAIFSGASTDDPSKVLLDVTSKQKTLPAVTTYHPLPGDRELTILFDNSNGNQGLGFLAHVWQEEESPIKVGTISSHQETDYLEKNTEPQPFVRLHLPLTGNRNPLSLEGITVKITKGQEHVEKILVRAGAQEFGEASELLVEKSQPQAEEKLEFAAPKQLLSGDTYLWVALAIKADAPVGTAFDVAVESVTIGGKVHELGEAGDPAGERSVPDFYLFKGDDNVEVSGVLQFYDDGGPNNPFTADTKGTVTFTAKAGDVLVLELKSIDLPYNGKIKIETDSEKYEENSAAKLPTKIIAGSSLKVTFNPKSNTTNKKGWEMVVSAIPGNTPYAATQARGTVIARDLVMRGETDVQMFRVEVDVDGLVGECKLEQISLRLQDEKMVGKVSKIKLWASGLSGYFFDAQLLKEVAPDANQMDVPLDYTMSASGTFNFWVTVDISPTVLHDEAIALQLVGAKAGSFTYSPAGELLASCKVGKGLAGTFTVGGASPDYATLTEAVAALASGVEGPVTFLLRDGTYKETVAIGPVMGASAANSITIKSESGKRENVVITSDKPGKAGRDAGIIALAGACHVTLEGLTVKSGSTELGAAVSLSKGSSYTTIRNCHLELPTPASHKSNESGDVVKAHSGTDPSTPTINYTVVEGCKVVGGKNGISLNGGQGSVYYPTGRGIVVRNNTIINGMSKAIWVSDITDFIVEGNRVEAGGFKFGYDYQGFDGRRLFGKGRIANNVILVDNSSGIDGICVQGIDLRNDYLEGTAETPIVVVNNLIAIDNVRKTGTYGIEIGDSKKNLDLHHLVVAHNTVVLGENVQGGSALFVGKKSEGVRIQNNVLVNLAQSGSALRTLGDAATAGVTFSRNSFWSPRAEGAVKIEGEAKSLADLATLPGFANSIVARPILMDYPADLRLLNGTDFQVEAIDAVAGIGADFDAAGKKRGERPTVGALEYEPMQPEWYPSAPRLLQQYADAVAVSVGLNMPGECRYLVRKKGEAAPSVDDWKDVLPRQLEVKRAATLEVSLLENATEYVMYLQVTPVVGAVMEATVEFTTLAAGVEPAVLAAGYPKAGAAYSDAQVLELFTLKACEMQYLVVAESELAAVDYSKAKTLTGGLKASESVSLPLLELEAKTPYVLCYATYNTGETPTLWKEFRFVTKPIKELQPSQGVEKPGTQLFSGFVKSGKKYVISKATSGYGAAVEGWKMAGDEATITLGTNATSEAVRGLVVATTGEVKLEYTKELSETVETHTLPGTDGAARYYALPDGARLHEVKFTKATGVEAEVIAFATAPEPIEMQRVGIPQIPSAGGNVTLSAEVLYGGAWPVEFVWKKDGAVLGTGLTIETDALHEACVVQLVATDALGTEGTLDVDVVKQSSTLLVGGFEEEFFNGKLASSDHQWKGPQDGKMTYYPTGSFTLSMNSNAGYYSGFVVSDDASTVWDGDYSKDARSAAGHGANGTKNYGVAYLYSPAAGEVHSVKLHVGPDGAEMAGVYLTNTAWTYSSVLNGPGGTGGNKPFEKGDSYSVTIKADNGNEVTAYLADYTNADASRHYALSEWAWVDLSSLGKVKSLTFSVKANCSDPVNFPSYFAIDELGAMRPEKAVTKAVGASSVKFDLLSETTLDKTKPSLATVSVENGVLASSVAGVTLTLEGTQLKVEGWDVAKGKTATETITFRLAQSGRQEWVKLTLNYADAPIAPELTLASVAYDATMGSVIVRDEASGTVLKENDKLKADQVLTIHVAPLAGYKRVATADSLTVSNAERIGKSERWKVTGAGNVSISAAFEKETTAPTKSTVVLTAINYDAAKGAVVVKDQFGKVLAVNDKLEKLQLIEVVATPQAGYLVKPSGVVVTNAARVASGSTQWQVSGEGDITVTVEFEKSTAVEPTWAASLTLSPNPCTAWVRLDGVDAMGLRYEVYSVSGARVASGVVQQESAEVDVSHLASGIYVLRLFDADGMSVSRRFVRR